MSTSLLYHAFGIRGYDYVRTDYLGGEVVFTIVQNPEDCRCSACGSRDVISRGHAECRFRNLPIGSPPHRRRPPHPPCRVPRLWPRPSGRGPLRRPQAELYQVLRALRPGAVAEHDHPRCGPSPRRRLGPDQGHPEARPVAAVRQAQAQAPPRHRHRRDRRGQRAPLPDGGHGPGQRGRGLRRRRQGGRRAEAVLEAGAAQRGQDRGGGHGHVGGLSVGSAGSTCPRR